ncbi:MAG: hypothetical protein HQ559_03825 [Lentisphaerae bacterium]|nr:hypothetical protein [Lentisphaerota bacterium]
MPVTTEIDARVGVALNVVSGRLTAAAATATIRALIGNPEFQPGMGIVWDLRRAIASPVSAAEIQGVAHYVAERIEARGWGRLAIVVSQDTDVGVGQLFDGYADEEALPIERKVFRDLGEAVRWAGRATESGEDS